MYQVNFLSQFSSHICVGKARLMKDNIWLSCLAGKFQDTQSTAFTDFLFYKEIATVHATLFYCVFADLKSIFPPIVEGLTQKLLRFWSWSEKKMSFFSPTPPPLDLSPVRGLSCLTGEVRVCQKFCLNNLMERKERKREIVLLYIKW